MSDNIVTILQEIAANTNHMRHRLDDMQSLLMQPAINTAFKQTMCIHIIGIIKEGRRAATETILVNSDSTEDYKRHMNLQFTFCPKCGFKL